jgi:hypothetical protein
MVVSARLRFCQRCGKSFAFEDRRWRCGCTGVLALPQRTSYAPPSRERGMWRHAANFPTGGARARISLGEGDTPLVRLRSFPGTVYANLNFSRRLARSRTVAPPQPSRASLRSGSPRSWMIPPAMQACHWPRIARPRGLSARACDGIEQRLAPRASARIRGSLCPGSG